MTTKMTPGPWRYVERKNQTGITRAFVDFGNGFIDLTDRAVDAQAIAGLPDLLAENERLREALDALLNGLRVPVSQADHDAEREEASAMARAALAKAGLPN